MVISQSLYCWCVGVSFCLICAFMAYKTLQELGLLLIYPLRVCKGIDFCGHFKALLKRLNEWIASMGIVLVSCRRFQCILLLKIITTEMDISTIYEYNIYRSQQWPAWQDISNGAVCISYILLVTNSSLIELKVHSFNMRAIMPGARNLDKFQCLDSSV